MFAVFFHRVQDVLTTGTEQTANTGSFFFHPRSLTSEQYFKSCLEVRRRPFGLRSAADCATMFVPLCCELVEMQPLIGSPLTSPQQQLSSRRPATANMVNKTIVLALALLLVAAVATFLGVFYGIGMKEHNTEYGLRAAVAADAGPCSEVGR